MQKLERSMQTNLALILVGLTLLVSPVRACDCACRAGKPNAQLYEDPFFSLSQLRQVQIITRHGHRSPIWSMLEHVANTTWDCKPLEEQLLHAQGLHRAVKTMYFDHDNPFQQWYWRGSCNRGQLTSSGAEMMSSLGNTLRSLYIDRFRLLDHKFASQKHIYVRSTDFEYVPA